ncbi:hypothetical protein [Patulibacter sp.]|uniref:hypothetical protein n=1 Tax=Patulibacter sp. TaxID=1912859 RepID=UPI00271F4FAB|nr:hypothetical protein [Patulibacter sp.]MDO9407976.1 hypothetical protein [Patulibacter sp.]
MASAPLQALGPVVVGGAGLCVLGVLAVGTVRRRIVAVGATVVLLAASSAGLYLAFAAAVRAWDEHPGSAWVGTILLGAALGLATLVYRAAHARRSPPGPEDEGDGDGGGGQRRSPTPPRLPPSGGPAEPAAPWDEFDAIRSTWDRVPAGRS